MKKLGQLSTGGLHRASAKKLDPVRSPHPQNGEVILIISSDTEPAASDDEVSELSDHYQNDKTWPVYAQLTSGMPTQSAVEVTVHPPNKIVSAASRGISENAVFVMGTDALGHSKNALADSIGSWKQTGKVRHFVSHAFFRVVKNLPVDTKFKYTANACRVHYVNRSSPDLCCIR